MHQSNREAAGCRSKTQRQKLSDRCTMELDENAFNMSTQASSFRSMRGLFASREVSRLIIRLAGQLPRSTGRAIARQIGRWFSLFHNAEPVQAVRANQKIAASTPLSPRELNHRTAAVFARAGQCLFDNYYFINHPDQAKAVVDLSAGFEEVIERSLSHRKACILAVVHTSNFDLAGQAAIRRGMEIQILSVANPNGAYQEQNRLREERGFIMTPASPEALRQAAQRLRAGGVVAFGVDRPFAEGTYRPQFFGRPAALPVAHVRMALRFQIPIFLVGCRTKPNDRYELHASEPFQMLHLNDPDEEILFNAGRILGAAQTWIQTAPEEWAMFFPVWTQ